VHLEYNQYQSQYAQTFHVGFLVCYFVLDVCSSIFEEYLANTLSSTGATGYIGGDVLYMITKAHPDLEITAMVRRKSLASKIEQCTHHSKIRNSDKGAKVAVQYPNVRLVFGDLENTELLTKEAAQADIVVNTANCGDLASAEALIAGLSQRQRDTYLIHVSGTGNLTYDDLSTSSFGVARDRVFDDWDGLGEVTSLPGGALWRNVEKAVLAAHEQDCAANIRTAILCAPTIYGAGRGPINQRGLQVNEMVKAVLTRGKGFFIGDGLNKWNEVHIKDLSNAFLALVDAALEPSGGRASWNKEGFYFTEAGEYTWGDLARQIARVAFEKKVINSSDADSITPDEADKLHPWGRILWGTNSRGRAVRANKVLGWTPTQMAMVDALPEIIEAEALAVKKL
jgi:nucleoside-diphosphate-sugar epimerase